MENEEQTLATNPETESLSAPAAEGSENVVEPQTTTPALTLEEINQLTGHRYQSVDDARKGLDNLKRAVGKKEIVREIVPADMAQEFQSLKTQVAEATFYTERPDLKTAKEVISKLGSNPYDVIKDPTNLKIIEAVQAREDKETLRSTPGNTPVSEDIEKDFESLKKTGDWVGFLKKHKGIDF